MDNLDASPEVPQQSSAYVFQMIVLTILTVLAIVILSSFVGSIFPSWVGKDDIVFNLFGLTFNFSIGITYVLMPVVLVSGLIAVFLTGLQDKLTTDDWKRIGIILVLFLFATVFWMGYEQAGSSLNLFAEQMTNRQITAAWEFPAAWFQSVSPFYIVTFAPIFAWLWIALGKRQPSEELKFSVGLILTGLGYVVLAYASSLLGGGKVSRWWLVIVYLLHTWGELCISPVGLSAMTKLAPGKMISLMLGVWFLSISMGSYIGGLVAGNFEPSETTLVGLFGKVAAVLIGSGILLFAIIPLVKKLYSKPEEVVPAEPTVS